MGMALLSCLEASLWGRIPSRLSCPLRGQEKRLAQVAELKETVAASLTPWPATSKFHQHSFRSFSQQLHWLHRTKEPVHETVHLLWDHSSTSRKEWKLPRFQIQRWHHPVWKLRLKSQQPVCVSPKPWSSTSISSRKFRHIITNSETIALHVRYKSCYTFLSSSAK